MRLNKLQLNPIQMEVFLVGSNSVLGSGFMPMLLKVTRTPSSVHSLHVLLGLGLLLTGKVAAVPRWSYHDQLRQVNQLWPFLNKRDLTRVTCSGQIQAGLLQCSLHGAALENDSETATDIECSCTYAGMHRWSRN